MKSTEIRACDLCEKPVAGNTRGGKTIDFYEVVVMRHILEPTAIRQHVALGMLLGGDERLAQVMGTNEDWTTPVERKQLLICIPCWYERTLMALADSRGKELPCPERDKVLEGRGR